MALILIFISNFVAEMEVIMNLQLAVTNTL